MAHTSPAKLRLHAVLVKYSVGFNLQYKNIYVLNGESINFKREKKKIENNSPVGINHKVPIGHVYLWCLGFILAIKELGHGAFFDNMNGVVVEPGRI